jgi:putative transposase
LLDQGSVWINRVPRVQGFSYRGYHRYFVTLTTNFRKRVFASDLNARALSAQIPPFFSARSFEVLAYCVMPDHLHLLLEGTAEGSDLREAVRAWKQRTGYDWKTRTGTQLWQPGFHDRVLREHHDTRSVVRYILQNPVRAGVVKTPREYPWSGSLRYTIAELQEHAGDWSPHWK